MTVAPPSLLGTLSDALPFARNQFLSALPQADAQRLRADLDYLPLPRGMVLSSPDTKTRHLYFPTTAVAALVYTTREGAMGEVALVGNEGLTGLEALTGVDTLRQRTVVQFSGFGYRMNADLGKSEFDRGGALHDLALQALHRLLGQIVQTAICNRHHRLEQQVCRWLLQALDRLPSHKLEITQELIANLLGVRRESISEVAGKLKARGLIDYRRGQLDVIDYVGLTHAACECHAMLKVHSRGLSLRPLPTPHDEWPIRARHGDAHRTTTDMA